jgi:transposase InsO family protein
MAAADVRYVIQRALEQTGAHPQVVTDNGPQFWVAEFKELVRRFAVEHIRIRTHHPESNGLVEQFHRSTREVLGGHDIADVGAGMDGDGRVGAALQRSAAAWLGSDTHRRRRGITLRQLPKVQKALKHYKVLDQRY